MSTMPLACTHIHMCIYTATNHRLPLPCSCGSFYMCLPSTRVFSCRGLHCDYQPFMLWHIFASLAMPSGFSQCWHRHAAFDMGVMWHRNIYQMPYPSPLRRPQVGNVAMPVPSGTISTCHFAWDSTVWKEAGAKQTFGGSADKGCNEIVHH